MKTTERYRLKPNRIRSLTDLVMEKQRLRMEILKTEQDIHRNYRNILHGLSPLNLASSLIGEITPRHSGISTVVSLGKTLFGTKKKKKHDKDREMPEPETP